MELCRTIEDIRRVVAAARADGDLIGVVPTMGNLHAGHASLIDASVADGHFTVVTIFVNPTQFGPNEDFDAYPRTLDADLQVCESHGASAVFAPSAAEIYPRPGVTTVHVAGLTETLCGASRPTHFDGVTTVVTKLFNIVGPDAGYFGQKDAQQAAVLTRMIEDLNIPVRMVVCPIVREADGLAMSSRNQYLSPEERRQAVHLHKALQLGAELIAAGRTDPAGIVVAMREHLAAHAPDGTIDYVEIVDPQTLTAVEEISAPVLALLAVRFDSARLIDNMRVDAGGGKS